MTQAVAPTAHPDYTKGTQALKQPKYNVAEGETTFGEKVYDFNNYFTVGYAINLALSVAITEFFKFGHGQPVYKAVDKKLTKLLSKLTSVENAARYSEITTKYSLLTTGGTVLMAPMLWAENRKSKLVYLANRKFAPNTIAADDPYKDMSTSEILNCQFDENHLAQPVHEQPKHGILNGLWRRGLSMAIIISWGQLLNKTVGEDFFEKNGLKGIKGIEKAPGMAKFNRLIEEDVKINRWTRWTISDMVNTVITTGTIWLTNGTTHEGASKNDDASSETVQEPKTVVTTTANGSNTNPSSHVSSPIFSANSTIEHAASEGKAHTDLVAQASHVDGLDKRAQSADASLSA